MKGKIMTQGFVMFFLTVLMIGCRPVASLNPLFEKPEILAEPQLMGRWIPFDPEKDEACTFTELNPQDKSLRIDLGDQGVIGWLGKIGGSYYLDTVAVDPDDIPNSGQGELVIMPTAQGYAIAPDIVPVTEQLYLDFRLGSAGDTVLGPSHKIPYRIRPMHTIYKLRLENNQLTILFIDDEKFKTQMESGTMRLAHQNEPFPFITADTEELREFLLQHGDREELFGELGAYRRAEE